MSTEYDLDQGRVDELLAHCLELPASERETWLEAIGCDAPLRREVERLLAVRSSALWKAEQTVFELFPAQPTSTPTQLGPYRLEEELGCGGTSRVFRGRRTDSDEAPPVAVKLLSYGVEDQEVLRRFQREGDILAGLEHPNIARILGGGLGQDNRPYWVMELIEGWSIKEYCRLGRVDPVECVRLMSRVLAGLAYAHRKLVVHRDLKPENILVGDDGRPKILDFGISKLLDPESLRPKTVTLDGKRMLTPEYAAPEELAMAESSTSVDIYSCGVVLYELLTSRRPFEEVTEPLSLLKAVLEQDPPPPSHHCPGLPKDLDAIVLQSLRKDPVQRYPSAEAFYQDLERFLENRPVRARAGGWLYRLTKLVRRQYRAVAAALVMLTAVGWVVVDREQSRRRLEHERNKGVEIVDSVTRLFSELDPYVAGTESPKTLEELLVTSLERLRLDDAPLLKAGILKSLGRLYGNRGRAEESLELLEQAYELYRSALGPADQRLVDAEVLLGDGLTFAGRSREAESVLRRALDRFHLQDSPDEVKRLEVVLSLGRSYHRQNRYAEAERMYRKAVESEIEWVDTPESRSLFAESRMLLGMLLAERGKAEAEGRLLEAYGAALQEWGEDDPRTLYVAHVLAARLLAQGRRAEGIHRMQDVVRRRRAVLGGGHVHLAESLCALGPALIEDGRRGPARKALDEAVQIYDALGSTGPEVEDCRDRWSRMSRKGRAEKS